MSSSEKTRRHRGQLEKSTLPVRRQDHAIAGCGHLLRRDLGHLTPGHRESQLAMRFSRQTFEKLHCFIADMPSTFATFDGDLS